MNSEQFLSYLDAMPGTYGAGSQASNAMRADEQSRRFDSAMLAMEDGCWPQAFKRLAALADAGHPLSACIALLFVRRGTSLFGGSFRASAQQRECWQRSSGEGH